MKEGTCFLIFSQAVSIRAIKILLLLLIIQVAYPAEAQSSQPDTALKIGVASMVTPVDTVKYYQEIIDYIGQQINQPVQMVHRRTYEEMDLLLEKGEVKIAFICSAPYVRDRQKFGLGLLAAPRVNGKASYQSYIIVHNESPIKSFPELKGKVFAFTDPRSNTGRLYPAYLLRTMETTPEHFFSKYIYSYSHNKSVELVAKRVVDAAAVESLVYEYMLKKDSPYAKLVKVIKRSPLFGIPPVVVTKDLDPVIRSKVKAALLNMHKTDKGRSILTAMMIDDFVEVSDSEYDSIREMEGTINTGEEIVKNIKNKKNLIYFGIIPRDNPRIQYEKYQPLLDYLLKRTGYSYELVLKKNYEDTLNALGRGEIDIALVGSLTYLEARARYGVLPILKPRGINGDATHRSIVITRKNSGISSITDLKGKSFAFSAIKSTSGNLIPRYLLANAGIHLDDLKKYGNFDYHDSVVKAVLRGQYDAGAVRDSVARKYLKLGLEVIAESNPIPTGPLVGAPQTPLVIIEGIKGALLELDVSKSDHQKTLKRLDDELKNGFTEASDDDYEDIRVKINAVPNTCGKGCHPKMSL